MLAKLALSVLIGGGALAMGATPALAAAPGASAPSSTAAHCGAGAQRVLTHLQRVDSRISTVVGKLQAAEQQAKTSGHPRRAERLADRITRLQDRQTKVEARIARIDQRCPGLSTNGASSSSTPSSS
jgi:hypothetical protein